MAKPQPPMETELVGNDQDLTLRAEFFEELLLSRRSST